MKHFLYLLRNKSGNVIIIAALLLPLILLVVGGAISFSQRGTVKAKLQSMTDAAALAGMSLPEDASDSDREQAAWNYINGHIPELGFDFNPKYVTISASDERVTVGATAEVKNTFGWLAGPESFSTPVTSSAVPNVKMVPAAVDIVIGLDGGCGNEQGGKFASMRNAERNLLNQIASHPNNQVYAAGVWSSQNTGYSQNTQHDVNALTPNLPMVANRLASRTDSADNGSNMANVINEMWAPLAGPYGDPRDPQLLARKKRIAILFQGAHNKHDTGAEPGTYSGCSSLASSLDAVYSFASAGPQNHSGGCTSDNVNPRNVFPSWPNPALMSCSKPLNDPDNPDFPNIPGYQSIPAGSLPSSVDNLANAIANLKTKVRSGARLEE